MSTLEIEQRRLAAINRDRWTSLVYWVALAALATLSALSWAVGNHALSLVQISQHDLHRVGVSVSSVAKRQTHGITSIGTAICRQRQGEFTWFTGIYADERKYFGGSKDPYHAARLKRFAERAMIEGTSFDVNRCLADFADSFPTLSTPPPDVAK